MASDWRSQHTDYFWVAHNKMHEAYGDITSMIVMGKPLIILHTRKLAVELFEKRHQLYSTRPDFTMIVHLVGWDRATVHMEPDNLWRDRRRNFCRLFGTRTLMQKFDGVQIYETSWAGSMILKIVYRHDTKAGHDPLVELVDEAMSQFIMLSRPGAYAVDFIPWLKYVPAWFPGAKFQREAKYCRQTLTNMIEVKEQMKQGKTAPSFVSKLLSADDYTPEMEYSVKTSAASIHSARADSTGAQVHGFYLLMVLWPDAQRKAQEEIDRVVGPDRLPDFNDRGNLPFVEALIKECMRHHCAVPISNARRALRDDVVEGYLIPKGAIIQANAWGMLHDPNIYPDPLNFVAERWLTEPSPPHPREVVFGFGRRICSGMIMADNSF
ncbi:hypothetical protein EUX98_g6235 [Antrodiella citrinella]|uniref:Cytochrome P450 n=1 Tax=Antrodiella citrinella TaxID=2447956 RepID=A0A4S4MS54_9APHY|nr:hypothetical protein EUX98_g6235 [Antrodiella citrinella]